MIRVYLVVVLSAMLLLVGQFSFAEDYPALKVDCEKEYSDCVARITAVNDIEVQDLTKTCNNERLDCRSKHSAESKKFEQDLQEQQNQHEETPQE
jgi:hypothetical protein